jgi:hypothetical protein
MDKSAPRYSIKSRKSYGFLYRSYNDVDVFVEYTTCRNMYEELVNRILAGKAKVSRVIQLGGKPEVLSECEKNQYSMRRQLYIVDGDLDRILDKRHKKLRHLHKLSVYCVENILIDKAALVEILRESMSNDDRNGIEKALNFDELMESIEKYCLSIYVLYAIAMKFDLSFVTVGYHISRLCKGSGARGEWQLSAALAFGRRREMLRGIISEVGRDRYRDEKRRIRRNIERKRLGLHQIVSGKDCIFPILHQKIGKSCGFRGNLNSLRVALARHCALDRDLGLVRAVRRAARQ